MINSKPDVSCTVCKTPYNVDNSVQPYLRPITVCHFFRYKFVNTYCISAKLFNLCRKNWYSDPIFTPILLKLIFLAFVLSIYVILFIILKVSSYEIISGNVINFTIISETLSSSYACFSFAVFYQLYRFNLLI